MIIKTIKILNLLKKKDKYSYMTDKSIDKFIGLMSDNVIVVDNQVYFNNMKEEYEKLEKKNKEFLDKQLNSLIESDKSIIEEIKKIANGKENSPFISLKIQLMKLQINTVLVYFKKFLPQSYDKLAELLAKKIEGVNEILSNTHGVSKESSLDANPISNGDTVEFSDPNDKEKNTSQEDGVNAMVTDVKSALGNTEVVDAEKAEFGRKADANTTEQANAKAEAEAENEKLVKIKKAYAQAKAEAEADSKAKAKAKAEADAKKDTLETIEKDSNTEIKPIIGADAATIADKVVKSINPNEKLPPDQGGGGIEEDKASIRDKMNNLKELINFVKSDFILKIIAIMMDETIFTNMCKTIKVNPVDLVNLFFTKTTTRSRFIEYIKEKFPEYSIQKSIDRDTFILKKYITDDNEYIFSPKLMSILSSIPIDSLIPDNIIATDFVNLYNEISTEFKTYNELYQVNKLYQHHATVDMYYKELVNSKKKVFTYIKERTDGGERNPRFQNLTSKDNVIFLDPYYNIDGEFEGSQNEKLNQIKTSTDMKPESYIMGPFDGVFLSDKNVSNKGISSSIQEDIFKKLLEKKEDMCIIGYGQSGSGKTSSLIYFDKTNEDGIVVELCNLPEFINKVESIEINMVNIYTYHGTSVTSMNTQEQKHYKTSPIIIDDKEKLKFVKHTLDNTTSWIYDADIGDNVIAKRGLGTFIVDAFTKREIEPTPNNPESSRSHVVVVLNITLLDSKKPIKLIVCDLAGVENVFDCENPNEIHKFDDRYFKSSKYGQNNVVSLDKYLYNQPSNPKTDFAKTKDILDNERKIIVNNIIESKKKIAQLDSLQTGGNRPGSPVRRKPPPPPISSSSKPSTDLKEQSSLEQPSLIENCPKELKFWDTHKGDTMSPEWKQLKNKSYKYVQNVLYSQDLIDLYNKYLNPPKHKKKGATFPDKDMEAKYSEIYNYLSSLYIRNGTTLTDKIKNTIKKDPVVLLGMENNSMVTSILGLTTYTDFVSKESLRKKMATIIKDENMKKVISDAKDSFNTYKEYLCEETRLQMLKYNCKLRVVEGYMINKSLLDMREAIKDLILSSLKEDDHLPLFWDLPFFPYCRNINITDNLFDNFDNTKNTNNTGNKVSSIILNVMAKEDVDINKLNYCIFTVINTSENKYTNNPPNPPYIDTSLLTYYKVININNDKLIAESKAVTERMTKYSFYQNNQEFKKYLDVVNKDSNYTNEQKMKQADDLIKIINSNNPSTLIGSIESTEILQKLSFTSLCTKNEAMEKNLDRYSKIGLITLRADGKYAHKYKINYNSSSL